MTEEAFTVGDLRSQLQAFDDDTKLSFDGRLTFGRMKRWSDNEVILLFAEPQADLGGAFKKRNPNVKVAFVRIDDDMEWDESGILGGPVDVSVR